MRRRFFIADVFTERPLSGNPLAVLTDARGISDRAMQAIAREFNFPETTFVLPAANPEHLCRVRIFTPRAELPFAGHPTIGTACVLARERGASAGSFVLEEGIGPVPVEFALERDCVKAYFSIERPVELPEARPQPGAAAAALSLPADAVLECWFAGAGVRFCFVRLPDPATVDRAELDRTAWNSQFADAWTRNFYLFCEEGDRVHARMFAPALGVEEDPATGSGAVALAGVLAARRKEADGRFAWRIDQGVRMGRPSVLEASAEKRAGRVVRIRVGGGTVIVAEGEMDVPQA